MGRTSVDVQGVVGDLLVAHGPERPIWWSDTSMDLARTTVCACGALEPTTRAEWSAHVAQAIVAELSGRELRIVDACDILAEVDDEAALIRDHYGSADDRPVVEGLPLHELVRVPWDADELAACAAEIVAHAQACAEAGLGDGPPLHSMLLADVFAAIAAADDPNRWRQAMVRVAATAVWCASRGQ